MYIILTLNQISVIHQLLEGHDNLIQKGSEEISKFLLALSRYLELHLFKLIHLLPCFCFKESIGNFVSFS